MREDRVHTVILDLDGRALTYEYMCREGDSAPPMATFRKPVDLTELREITEGLSAALSRPGAGADAASKDWGGKLYDRLIPRDLARVLQDDDAPSYLVLYLHPELVGFPWELLWDGRAFLAEQFRMGRLLQKTAKEHRAAEQRLRGERSGRGALLVFGEVTGLDAEGEKAAVERALGDAYRGNVWFHQARGAADLLELLKRDYEICHFIGHGRFVDETPDESGWMVPDGTALTCRQIEEVSSRATFPLLVLANSCDSARGSFAERAGYVEALYRAFLRQGVPHYIGTAVPVPDRLGKEFAGAFWELIVAGKRVGEALAEARAALVGRVRLPIWAYYVHYGDPTYRFARTDRARGAGAGSTDGSGRGGNERISFSVLGRVSREELQRTLGHYKNAIRSNADDHEAHHAAGRCYLQLGLSDLAVKMFRRALELAPDEADSHYYYAVSLVRGRPPRTLSLPEVRQMLEHVDTAIQLDPRPATYYYLAAILRYDYFLANGLTPPPPSVEELLAQAESADHDPWEVERLLHAVPLRDPELSSLIRQSDGIHTG